MQGSSQCLVDGTATVCTCKEDLCNAADPNKAGFRLVLVAAFVSWLLMGRTL
jgi:hypothetical protein